MPGCAERAIRLEGDDVIPVGRAIRYALKHREGLTLFLTDPRLPVDNSEAHEHQA
ncbi:MAG: transposase [Deltaproteobacteria bacterium]|nr:transposase [Deltaproteobacteria bacterium]